MEPADLELVQMRVGPAHGGLQDVVQLGERGGDRHDEAAPDGRLDVVQRHMDLDGVGLLPCRARRSVGLGRQVAAPSVSCSCILHRAALTSNKDEWRKSDHSLSKPSFEGLAGGRRWKHRSASIPGHQHSRLA